MRVGVGLVLCLLACYLVIGCRDPLTPNIDRNQAPETWITAAPFDTITIKDKFGAPVKPSDPPRVPGTIPVRFHVHWAGSDRDGAVAGFYWAVVETLPRPPEGEFFVPNLPGPKPRDYHFTTRTDSFFIFNVAEDLPDRQHAFFIYAVDNLGKPDPTPARFIFIAQDVHPPTPIFEDCTCEGRVYSLKPGGVGVNPRDTTIFITDTDVDRNATPRDTCPSGSTLTFRWHAEPQIPQTVVIGFRYKLDEPRFIEVPPETLSKVYSPGTVAPGTKIFVLRAVDQAFGTRDSSRRFQLNYSPDTWFSGPDPDNNPSLLTKPNGEKYALFVGGRLPPGGIQKSLMSPDSTLKLPAERPEHKTFFEVWKDTLFVRNEDDTVHINSWIILHSGGFDRDSPYRVPVSDLARSLDEFPGGIVLEPDSANGSPVGFRTWQVMSLTPLDYRSASTATTTYPVFDPNSVYNAPRIAGYHPVIQSGRAFMLSFAADGDGAQDRRIPDPRDLVLAVEAGTATPQQVELRNKVLTFEVNRAPHFVTDSPLFFPHISVVDTFRTQSWAMRLPAVDEDPYLPNTPIGKPAETVTFRRKIAVRGLDTSGRPFVYRDPTRYENQTNITITVPPELAAGPCTLEVELCDCLLCEDEPGSGRCRTLAIPVYYSPSSPQRTTSHAMGRPGTGEPPR